MATKQTGYHRAAQMALETAETYERHARENDYGDAWRSYMLAEAKRKRRDARWYLFMYREGERMKQWFAERKQRAAA